MAFVFVCRQYRRLRPFLFLIPCVALPLYFGASWLSGVSFGVGLLLFVGFVVTIQPRHYEPAWREVSREAGLDFVERDGREGAYVRGVINGRSLTLTAQNPLPRWDQTAQTNLQITFTQPHLHQFTLTSTTQRERDARQLYNISGGSGIPKLDALFAFQNQSEQAITTIFTDDLTTQLTRIGYSDTTQQIEVTPIHLNYTAQSILLNQRTLSFLLELMGALAEAIETNN